MAFNLPLKVILITLLLLKNQSPHVIPPALCWSAAEGCFFQEGSNEAFLTSLNGTMVPEHRADSCFIEPVYNVW